MQLIKVQIANFRSIKSEEILFDNNHNCLILVGKNEAGKSNILKAIAAVFGEYKVSNKDRRKKIGNEKIDEYYIRAELELEDSDFDKILKQFQKKYSNTECISFSNNKTLKDFIKAIFYNFLIQIDIKDDSNMQYFYYNYYENEFDLKNDIYLNNNAIFTITPTLKKQSLENLIVLISNELKDLYYQNPYTCHYWKYNNNEHLLPNSINILNFQNNPAICLPLKNIFILSNREDIKNEFTNRKAEDGDYINLFEQVSEEITKIFRKIWIDFKETSIQLIPNGNEMLIKIANKAKYSCEDRSDGFKKFISILLMLSTKARSNKIGERDIILIDEPDQSLYPTSARYLRDELLNIAEKAKVIYSTHSPYMIDSNCIDRHLIVEKKDDITTAKKQDGNAPFSNDELLMRAIGTSIFECLQEKNIIFEGWLDKELFAKYCNFHKKNNVFKNIGTVYLGGISGAETLVQLLILANKKFIIVADSDKPSNDKRKDFVKNYGEFSSNWLSYADVVDGISTMEDFIATEHIENCIKEYSPDFEYNNSKNTIENIESVTRTDKDKKQEIKNKLMEKIDKKDIKENYQNFVNCLKEKLEKL